MPPGLVTRSFPTTGVGSSSIRASAGREVRQAVGAIGASVHTGKTVSGPAWVGAPRCRAGRAVTEAEDILSRAVDDLRTRYRNAADPDRLLNDHFTIRQLQQIHDAVDGRASHKDAFRRFADDKIEGTAHVDRSGPGRPAQLYRRRDVAADSPAETRGAETAYSADELLAAVAEYARGVDRVTIQGYASWARSTGRPSEALIRRRLAAELGGWSGIVRAASGAAGSRQPRDTVRAVHS